MSELRGGCQCGRVRYRAEVSEAAAYHCHCKMCQKATGGFAAQRLTPCGDRFSLIAEFSPRTGYQLTLGARPVTSAVASLSWSAFVFGSMAMEMTGSGKDMASSTMGAESTASVTASKSIYAANPARRPRFSGLFC